MKRTKMKKKGLGFTLVELLVVIAIIAMLLAILMPALGKVRQIAQRLMCGTNLSGIGKAMMIYANDYDDDYPIAGGNSTEWEPEGTSWKTVWDNPIATTSDRNVNATVSASLYLLVKYADVSTAQFVCNGGNEKPFELDTTDASAQNGTNVSGCEDVTDCWDFGEVQTTNGPWDYCSYSYQLPYPTGTPSTTIKAYPVNVTSGAGLALMADRSPYFDKNNADPKLYDWDTSAKEINKQGDNFSAAQCQSHQQEGQNVIFGDTHVKFEKMANVGVQQDNIYTVWGIANTSDEKLIQVGNEIQDQSGSSATPLNESDNILVNDCAQ